jgi:hypothetical protein
MQTVSNRYLPTLLWTTLVSVIFVASVNYLIDPYGIYQSPIGNRLFTNKPAATTRGPMVKAYQIEHIAARTLILGNSRAEIGFDPEDPAWPEQNRPVYNAALPATAPYVSLLYLREALTVSHPRTVVWGVDFMDFLVSPSTSPIRTRNELSEMEARLRVTADGSPNPASWRQRLKDVIATTFSLEGFVDSIRTIGSRTDRYGATLTRRGFNPLREYIRIARNDGYYVMFRQRAEENAKAYLMRPHALYSANTGTSLPLEDLKQVIAICRKNNIKLYLVIYPYHARLLEMLRDTGFWPEFEDWKRALVGIATASGNNPGPTESVSVWDFSGYSRYTTESVPAKGDLHARTQWYWEEGHFKSELGSVVLARIFGADDPPGEQTEDFGKLLTPMNIGEHLADISVQRQGYADQRAEEVRYVKSLVEEMSSQIPHL